jgi:hypothetical protein
MFRLSGDGKGTEENSIFGYQIQNLLVAVTLLRQVNLDGEIDRITKTDS